MENNELDLLYDESDLETPKHTKQTLRRLAKSVDDQYGRLCLVIVSVILYTLLSIASPLYIGQIIDRIWSGVTLADEKGILFQIAWDEGGISIFILFLIYTATWLFYTLQSFLMASFAERLSLRLRTQVSEKLSRLPLSYFDRHKTGELLSRATSDLDKMSEALQTGLLKLFTSIGLVIGSLVMMVRFHAGLTLVFLLFMALSLAVTKVFTKKTLEYAIRRQECVGRLTGQVEEAYSGRVIVKAFHMESRSLGQFCEATEALASATQKADFMVNAINPAIRLVNRLGQVAVAVFAGKLLIDGALTVGVFQAFFQYLFQAAEPMTEISFMVNSMQSALACVERVYEILDEEEIEKDPTSPNQVTSAAGRVEFRHVRFGYTPDKILMQDINFTAQPGQKIAIVGSTGAGKTTMINLLMRFYEVNGGAILLDGVDTKTMSRSNLRGNFGMVLQDTWLIGGTIAENIAYGRPDATREEIIQAAKMARIDFFIRTMPDGYDTVLEEDAENLSAGQKQLLTIARVILCNPSVLILDEATSSVDTRTEMEISRAMQTLMKNRTSFVIAHRLSTIVDADLILVMQSGTIIEQGNHQTLLKTGGAYAQLYNSQFA